MAVLCVTCVMAAVAQESGSDAPKLPVRSRNLASLAVPSAVPLTDLAVSADGRLLALTTEDGRLQLRSASAEFLNIAVVSERPLTRVRFVANDSQIVTAGLDGAAKIFSVPDLELKRTIQCSDKPLLDVAVSSTGTLASVGYGGTLATWDPTTGKRIAQSATAIAIHAVEWSADGSQILTGSEDGMLVVWSGGLNQVRTFKHSEPVKAVLFSNPGELVYAATAREIQCWDIATGESVWKLRRSRNTRLTQSPDGKTLVAGAMSAASLRAATGKDVRYHGRPKSGGVVGVGLTKNTLWSCSADSIYRFGEDQPKRGPLVTRSTADRVWGLAIMPAKHAPSALAMGGKDRYLHVLNVATGQQRLLDSIHPRTIDKVACSPDGRFVAAIGWKSGALTLWNVESGERLQRLTIADTTFRAVLFSPDSKRVLATDSLGKLREWELDTRVKRSIQAHPVSTTGLSVRHDGRLIATGCGEWRKPGVGRVIVWDAKTLEKKLDFDIKEAWVSSVEFAPKGNLLAAAASSGVLRVWDSDSGVELASLTNSRPMRALAWSSDAKFLAAGMDSGDVNIWRISDRKIVAKLEWGDDVFSLRFAPGDQGLFAASGAREWCMWDVSDITGTKRPDWVSKLKAKGTVK